jgi:hypothetical protein
MERMALKARSELLARLLLVAMLGGAARARAEPIPAAVAVPSPAQAAALLPSTGSQRWLALASSADDGDQDSSLLESPWLWAGVAGVVATGVVLALVLSSSGEDSGAPKGTLGTSVQVLTKGSCATASDR